MYINTDNHTEKNILSKMFLLYAGEDKNTFWDINSWGNCIQEMEYLSKWSNEGGFTSEWFIPSTKGQFHR